MKLTKKQESALMQVYDSWWESYLNGDVETYHSFLADDYHFVGSTNGEEYLNRKDTTDFFHATAHQIAGKAELRNTRRTIEVLMGGLVLITDRADAYVISEPEWVFYSRFRFTSLMKETADGWRFIYQHFSAPDTKAQDGETLGTEQITKENQELRDAIKRRTTELEHKTRELEIEAALERVRNRTLLMEDSNELNEAAAVFFQQLQTLNLLPAEARTYFCHINPETAIAEVWMTQANGSVMQGSHQAPLNHSPAIVTYFEAWKRREPINVRIYSGEALIEYLQFIASLPHVKVDEDYQQLLGSPPEKIVMTDANFLQGNIGVMTFEPLSLEALDIMGRFAKVFEFTYTRFLDLQKAEAQAREAQVEAALERTRTQSMIMKHSSELDDSLRVFHQQVLMLGIKSAFSFLWLPDEKKNQHQFWAAWAINNTADFNSKAISYPLDRNEAATAQCLIDWKSEQQVYSYYVPPGGVKNYFAVWKELLDGVDQLRPEYFSHGLHYVEAFLKYGCFGVMVESDLREDESKILGRFAVEFERTYTRFLDLQKAEAQAREAQIEASLERVRASAMAMHHSSELADVLSVLFEQFDVLGICPVYSQMSLLNLDTNTFEFRCTGKLGRRVMAQQTLAIDSIDIVKETVEKWKNSEPKSIHELYFPNEVIPGLFELFKEIRTATPAEALPNIEDFPDGLYVTEGNFQFGYMGFAHSRKATAEEKDIVLKFATEFGRLYQRFLDLQKAEAQAREARIETALERVRSRSMAMHKSEDLRSVVNTLYGEFKSLNVDFQVAIIPLFIDDSLDFHLWISTADGMYDDIVHWPYTDLPIFHVVHDARIAGKMVEYTMSEIETKDYFEEYFKLDAVPNERRSATQNVKLIDFTGAIQKFTGIFLMRYTEGAYSLYEKDIVNRFSKVFEQTYTRFLDLQKAEAQAREAEIELALERVRARTMAMQHSEELVDVATVLFQQVKGLGVPQWNCGFNIWNIGDKAFTYYPGSPDGLISPSPCKIPLNEHAVFKRFDESRRRGEELLVYEKEGEEQADHYKYMLSLPGVGDLLQSMLDAGFELPKFQIDHLANFAYGNLIFITYEHYPKMHDVFKRFAKVFEQTYTRFLDLKKAEAQTREAQINLAVERVRARALAMYKSEEILELVFKLKQEMMDLDIPNVVAATIHLKEKDGNYTMWDLTAMEYSEGKLHQPMVVYYRLKEVDPNLFIKRMWDNTDPYFLVIQDEEDFKRTIQFLRDHDRKKEAGESEAYLKNAGIKYAYHPAIPLHNGRMCIDLLEPPSDEIEQILTKMGAAFDLAYKRFEDLKNSESQLREAQIEGALEKVRSRSLGMHSSEELQEVVNSVFERLKELEVALDTANILIFSEGSKDFECWTANNQHMYANCFHIPYSNTVIMRDINEAKESGQQLFTKSYSVEEKNQLFRYFFSDTDFKFIPESRKAQILESKQYALSIALIKNIAIQLSSYSKKSFLDEDNEILIRFAKVFNQAYTRFLDLQKAEAQSKEAKIEAALEKARARTMGMQSSDELPEVANVLFLEVQALGIPAWSCGHNILTDDKTTATCWMSSEGTLQIPFKLRLFGEASFAEMGDFIRSEQTMLVQELGGKALEEHYAYMKSFPDLTPTFDQIDKLGLSLPTYQINHLCKFTQGFLLFITYEKVPDSHDIFKRFTKVFDQTYTRFLDLQKAEAQAREAQIEASLERVRSRSLAMHKSNELQEVIESVFEQILKLGILADVANFIIFNQENKDVNCWIASPNLKIQRSWYMPYKDIFPLNAVLIERENGNDFFSASCPFEQKNKFFNWAFEHSDFKYFPDDRKEFVLSSKCWTTSYAWVKYTAIQLSSYTRESFAENENEILKRFARVFEQSYIRFLDLQKAEAQTREAQIETALEKVRSRTMAMQSSNELQETAAVLFQEFKKLGADDMQQFTIGIYNEEERLIDFRVTSWAGGGEQENRSFQLDMDEPTLVKPAVAAWKAGKKSAVFDLTGDALQGWLNYRNKISGINIKSNDTGGRRVITGAYFSKGHLTISTLIPLHQETIKTLERFATVFDGTYTRFLDLEKAEAQAMQAEQDLIAIKEAKQKAEEALTELQSTQKQLIQAEKMASLGELTAGIAHEIQNPLNFVNNFSEVSRELLDEMKVAIEKGDTEDAKEIMNDVIQNLDKINHHGKRADGIVKGMLQHSRSSSGAKEPTDINALADEYLRLAYHGLRAKDKSFNATMKTDYDKTIGNINIIPQDIGRVILNLITNAFYVVNEKKKLGLKDYEPTVTVKTLKPPLGGLGALISVRDNGPGIPQKILDKIFQPFFTTKPTGQGTGLGLSLSYDIVKAHGGELIVATKEGEGSEFIIQIPAL